MHNAVHRAAVHTHVWAVFLTQQTTIEYFDQNWSEKKSINCNGDVINEISVHFLLTLLT